jgi:hypothetical protein
MLRMKFTIMPMREMDDKFYKIQELIDLKKQYLIDKQKKLKQISKQNAFLDNIKSDYTNYYNYIIQQKFSQMKALQLLNEYIDDLTNSGNMTKYNIDDAKLEQQNILKELSNIKDDLDSLIKNI